jgi:hypothetical protein
MKTENDPEWQDAVAAEQYASDVVSRAVDTIVTFAGPIRRWGGDIDCDWVEYKLRHALDEAYPERLTQRKDRTPVDRRTITGALRTRVMERDAYRCVTCGSHTALQVDHIHPVSKGGNNDFDNLQTLCKPCNREKGDKVL